jgi:hypothetical protein
MEPLKYSQLEIAQVMGEPLDPRKPFPDLVSALCETEVVSPDDYYYYYDSLLETDKVLTISTTGTVTDEAVTPDTPALFAFIDISTPAYYVKAIDLAKAKEATLARKLKTIDRSLNAYENYYVRTLADAAAVSVSHTHTLQSGRVRFSYDDIIYMLEDVVDYGDNYILLVGATCDRDMKLWDWNDNKYSSMIQAFADLGITKVRIPAFAFGLDSGPDQYQVASNTAYLVATNTTMGKPFLFVRKNLNDIDLLGAAIKQNGEKPQRLVFASPNPITVSGGTTKYLAVALNGYEEIVAACLNPYAISRFTRS